MEEPLRGDPEGEDEEPDGEGEPGAPESAEVVIAPEPEEDAGAGGRLDGVNPIPGQEAAGREAGRLQELGESQEEDEGAKWRDVSYGGTGHGRTRRRR